MKATFFVIADEKTRSSETIKSHLINAIRDGHQLANHGTSETTHAFLSANALKSEVEQCDSFLNQLYEQAANKNDNDRQTLSKPPITIDNNVNLKFYRPGGGLINPNTMSASQLPMHCLTLGTVYPHDPFSTSDWLNFQLIRAKLAARDVVILHDRRWTPALLRRLLPWMQQNSFLSRTLNECFAVE
jgi:peptidoglycan/xylan/chitin deacetylase (PgdA/CDA1 family)